MATTYRKKVDLVEALQYDGSNTDAILAFCPDIICMPDGSILVNAMEVTLATWVTKDRGGSYDTFPPDFLEYYEVFTASLSDDNI